MNVYEKLQHVQSGLKAPKSQYNKFGTTITGTVRISRRRPSHSFRR